MTWKGILLGALIGAVLAALVMGLVMRHQDAKWLVEEKKLLEDSDRWQFLAGQHSDQAMAAEEKANDAGRVAATAIAELDKAKKKRRARKPPTDLATCLEENEEFRASELIADRAIASLQLSNVTKDTIIAEERESKLALEQAIVVERKRGDGWKRHSKRAKVKQAFFGIGMAALGGLVGAGASAAANR